MKPTKLEEGILNILCSPDHNGNKRSYTTASTTNCDCAVKAHKIYKMIARKIKEFESMNKKDWQDDYQEGYEDGFDFLKNGGSNASK